jgi:hypothetical protein
LDAHFSEARFIGERALEIYNNAAGNSAAEGAEGD